MKDVPRDEDRFELLSRLSVHPVEVPHFLSELRWTIDRFEAAVLAIKSMGVNVIRHVGFRVSTSVSGGRLAAELAEAHLHELELRRRMAGHSVTR